jgi:hypothetical protein
MFEKFVLACPVPDGIFEKEFNLELRGSTAGTGDLGGVVQFFIRHWCGAVLIQHSWSAGLSKRSQRGVRRQQPNVTIQQLN